MDLSTLSKQHGDFYVPAFAVRVAGKDLLREHLVAVTHAEIDLELNTAGRFSFTIADAFDFENRDFRTGDGKTDLIEMLAFGAPIQIAMGYGDVKSLTRLIEGVVTQVATDFNDGGSPELTISGYDNAFPMMGGKSNKSWAQRRDSDVIQEIAGLHNLDADIASTREERSQIERNQEGDLEFINRLAGRNGFETFVTGRTLHFRPSQNQGGGVVTLEWGKSLLHFKPEGNIAGQISGVEVYGWNPKTKKEIVGKATHGDEPGRDAKRDSGGDKVTKILRDQPVLRVRQPVFSQAEATTRAQALLKERADQFLIGSGETLGVPDLVPGCNVELKGLGKKFSKTYYVRQATHRFDSSGYRTTFKVKEPTL